MSTAIGELVSLTITKSPLAVGWSPGNYQISLGSKFFGLPNYLDVPFWLMTNCSLTPLLVKLANTSLGANQTFPDESEPKETWADTHFSGNLTKFSPIPLLSIQYSLSCSSHFCQIQFLNTSACSHASSFSDFFSFHFSPISNPRQCCNGTTQLCGLYHPLFQTSLWALTFPTSGHHPSAKLPLLSDNMYSFCSTS